MTLRLADSWVWDSWYTRDDDGVHHAFFLRASRALVDPERRHTHASIGHAISTDLTRWEIVADALVPSDEPGWDDLATWTGNVVRAPDGRWLMFYTGVTRTQSTAVQRIGLATSDDLLTWTRHGNGPVVEPDPTWYADSEGPDWGGAAWRDPWVFPDPDGDGWHMLITAHATAGPPDGRGVIGHARSHDLLDWTVQPPLTSTAGFGHLEVPQVAVVDGQPLLLFCSNFGLRSEKDQLWAVPGSAVTGPWDLDRAQPVPVRGIYAPRLVQDTSNRWQLIGFADVVDGRFVGELCDPIPVTYTADGLIPSDRNEPESRHVR
ncbi:glycosyl hydrolase family 32 [Rhodococcoides fascians]|uniref:glycoside hydrolase family 68 protein n=1 Tax=Rhodococcoides fascians TaxID=1828 RepID=UPI000B9A57BD|nr:MULTISPECIES: glycoside hydrolase family 68 protein [Rhodococcus]OZD69007.1 glycosyl hydrolase family 32 [Rhodococcus sp. 06-1059B-a]OZE81328.1 glycosyl hydrolase family 32 [Rhodococcus fascians]OZF08515.1 glycosyl hydrolase family 32 [Rhodococcus fascians]OZF10930.1 glycosyl hydrolase family 32 [Rhodococcus fascians]OZF59113.1 glycosyl hydrolase family 32 [Rhodococcus fascians]